MTRSPHRLGGRFEIRTLLGRGGMADVYLAHDHVLHRDVAIKMLRDVTEVDRDRFASEAQVLSRLSHESIVTLYDTSVTDGRPWLALELVEGRTMSDLLRDGPMAPRQLAALAAQVAAGLAHAHARGVVHRDVKPSNVLVTTTGRARLTDFGIARLMDSDDHLTVTGHVVGTAAYIAPEQVRAEQVTGAADIYALGLLLLEALTGGRSFVGPPQEAALARLHRGPLIPTSLPPGWPGLLVAMTALKPGERPTAQETALQLQELGRERRAGAGTSDHTARMPLASVVPDPPARSHRSRQALLAAAVVLSIALVLVSVLLVRGISQGSPSTTAAPARATGSVAPAGASVPSASSQASRSPTESANRDRSVPTPEQVTAHDASADKAKTPGKSKANAKTKAKAKGKGEGKGKGKAKGRSKNR